MSLQERDYYKQKDQNKKNKVDDSRNILIWIIVIILILGLIGTLIPVGR